MRASRVRVLVLAGKLIVVLAVLAAFDALGIRGLADGGLLAKYYRLRGARATTGRVVLVTLDDDTIARWGAPPWTWERYAELFRAIASAEPRVIGVVDPDSRLLPSAPKPTNVQELVAYGSLFLPPPPGAPGQPALAVGDGGVVDTEITTERHDRDEEASLPARIAARAGLPVPRGRFLIDFVGAPGRGPREVPAFRIPAGFVAPELLRAKIVLVGFTARQWAVPTPTPVGMLTPAEIHAHALAALADGARLRPPPGWLRWLLTAALAFALLIVLPRLTETRALAVSLGAVVLVIVLDYALFAARVTTLGASLPLVGVLASSAVSGFVERRLLRLHLGELRGALASRAAGAGAAPPASSDLSDDGDPFWTRVAELAQVYLDCRSSIVAELPGGRFHLSLRVITGASVDQIREKRRDIRRGPYQAARLNPVWQDDFMSRRRGEKTLLVPLVAGDDLLGFWILNFPVGAVIDAPRQDLATLLAQEIAAAIARRRRDALPSAATVAAREVGENRLADHVDRLAREAQTLADERRRLGALADGMPFALLVSTLWGEVRWTNAPMHAALAEEGLDPADIGLPEAVMALTLLSLGEVKGVLRKLLREVPELVLPGRPDTDAKDGERPRHVVSLSYLLGGDRALRDDAEMHILLCAVPARLAQAVPAPRPAARPLPWAAVPPLRNDTEPMEKAELDEVHRLAAALPRRSAAPGAAPSPEIEGMVDALHDSAPEGAHVRVKLRPGTKG